MAPKNSSSRRRSTAPLNSGVSIMLRFLPLTLVFLGQPALCMQPEVQPIFAASPCKKAYEYHFLNRAAALGDLVGARLLLEGGADVNGSGYEKALECILVGEFSSPLMVAVMTRNLEMARLLLEFGADTNLKEAEYVSPTDMARKQADIEMLDLLVEHGGK